MNSWQLDKNKQGEEKWLEAVWWERLWKVFEWIHNMWKDSLKFPRRWSQCEWKEIGLKKQRKGLVKLVLEYLLEFVLLEGVVIATLRRVEYSQVCFF